ncbi:tRNA pseudouridine(55) synthase TruB [Patescibacteria group bacterium]|nr:tRNA pseudouridine(55) synthase TruB [Patescibacteria group bacterium]
MKTGFLLIDKPAGITSHDVIDELRRITGVKKIGHAGTLDPFATGLLLIAVGREATREIGKFVGMDKAYGAEFVLGATTETLDTESEVVKSDQVVKLLSDQVREAMKELTGTIEQIPPMYAAIKKGGKKLYQLARKGEEIELEPRTVTVHQFDLVGEPRQEDGLTIVQVLIKCSSGTYIRALARDLAQRLGTTGYVRALRRVAIGPYQIAQAIKLKELDENNWQTHLKQI